MFFWLSRVFLLSARCVNLCVFESLWSPPQSARRRTPAQLIFSSIFLSLAFSVENIECTSGGSRSLNEQSCGRRANRRTARNNNRSLSDTERRNFYSKKAKKKTEKIFCSLFVSVASRQRTWVCRSNTFSSVLQSRWKFTKRKKKFLREIRAKVFILVQRDRISQRSFVQRECKWK